ncbi:efflux transporter outer membrane subunit [Frateuria defendens]|uniref:efflux transporter outer membrane subunit n=1 Tax=Frateuria defendens TaxID=2219559 RepID=UPI00066FC70F|nr:efflux transporter outer membrane subunit [Frateuria defendens]
MKALLRHGLLGLALGALAACKTVGPDYRLPANAAINRPAAQGDFVDAAGRRGIDLAPVPGDWWKLYDDPLLDQLVRQALASNADLRAAGANLGKAYALYEEAQHAGGFTYGASASLDRAQLSGESYLQLHKLPVYNLGDAGLSVSYEFDLFGKLKRAAEAAGADAQASQAAVDLARIAVVARVAGTYMETCHANREIAVAGHSVALQQRSAEVAQRLYEAGRGTVTDATRARAQVDLLEASLPPLRARKKAAEYELAALLGQTPGQLPAGVDACGEAPALARPLPVGNGMALLQRRPDVRQAERELAAATARIGVAVAELYPDVQIGAGAGASGLLEDFGNAATRRWSIGPLIAWTFPSRSAHARVAAARAGADAALAHFDSVVLNALRETQTALETYAQDLDRQDDLRRARDEARDAAGQNRTLYRGGRTPYLASLDADRTLAAAEAQLADADSQISIDQVRLFLALGGGWKNQDGKAATATGANAATASHAD